MKITKNVKLVKIRVLKVPLQFAAFTQVNYKKYGGVHTTPQDMRGSNSPEKSSQGDNDDVTLGASITYVIILITFSTFETEIGIIPIGRANQ